MCPAIASYKRSLTAVPLNEVWGGGGVSILAWTGVFHSALARIHLLRATAAVAGQRAFNQKQYRKHLFRGGSLTVGWTRIAGGREDTRGHRGTEAGDTIERERGGALDQRRRQDRARSARPKATIHRLLVRIKEDVWGVNGRTGAGRGGAGGREGRNRADPLVTGTCGSDPRGGSGEIFSPRVSRAEARLLTCVCVLLDGR